MIQINNSQILNEITTNGENATEETPEDKAQDFFVGLSITSLAEVLLAVAWTNDEQRRNVAMHPEFIASDVIMWTNAEESPSYHLEGKNSSNQAFSGEIEFVYIVFVF